MNFIMSIPNGTLVWLMLIDWVQWLVKIKIYEAVWKPKKNPQAFEHTMALTLIFLDPL